MAPYLCICRKFYGTGETRVMSPRRAAEILGHSFGVSGAHSQQFAQQLTNRWCKRNGYRDPQKTLLAISVCLDCSDHAASRQHSWSYTIADWSAWNNIKCYRTAQMAIIDQQPVGLWDCSCNRASGRESSALFLIRKKAEMQEKIYAWSWRTTPDKSRRLDKFPSLFLTSGFLLSRNHRSGSVDLTLYFLLGSNWSRIASAINKTFPKFYPI